MDSVEIIPGSISDVGNNSPGGVAYAMTKVKFAICVDNSLSGMEESGETGKSRWEVSNNTLARLQSKYPGKIIVFTWGPGVMVCFGGVMKKPNGMTYICPLLEFNILLRAAKAGIKIIIISDGEVYDAERALELAGLYPAGSISTIFTGMPGGDGERFMLKLANAAGGQSGNSEMAEQLLTDAVEGMLLMSGI